MGECVCVCVCGECEIHAHLALWKSDIRFHIVEHFRSHCFVRKSAFYEKETIRFHSIDLH